MIGGRGGSDRGRGGSDRGRGGSDRGRGGSDQSYFPILLPVVEHVFMFVVQKGQCLTLEAGSDVTQE